MRFEGKITSVQPGTAASIVLKQNETLTVDGDLVMVQDSAGSTWEHRGESFDNDNVLQGRIQGSPYAFVICRGHRKTVGIVYNLFDTPADGQDPGTWEADEIGGPPPIEERPGGRSRRRSAADRRTVS